jgi:Pyruvate/2-oxoglutarate dehydrogenase complex, dihydrolipoamide dehydrogenase (E3) component, and related enzymes
MNEPYSKILNTHIISKNTSKLINKMNLTHHIKTTIKNIISTMHTHPTIHKTLHKTTLTTKDRTMHT